MSPVFSRDSRMHVPAALHRRSTAELSLSQPNCLCLFVSVFVCHSLSVSVSLCLSLGAVSPRLNLSAYPFLSVCTPEVQHEMPPPLPSCPPMSPPVSYCLLLSPFVATSSSSQLSVLVSFSRPLSPPAPCYPPCLLLSLSVSFCLPLSPPASCYLACLLLSSFPYFCLPLSLAISCVFLSPAAADCCQWGCLSVSFCLPMSPAICFCLLLSMPVSSCHPLSIPVSLCLLSSPTVCFPLLLSPLSRSDCSRALLYACLFSIVSFSFCCLLRTCQ